jgi:hypothetical protein
MLAHLGLPPQNLDGFIKACQSYQWPDFDLMDDVFVNLGIGAPKLADLVSQTPPIITAEVLDRNLLACKRHLEKTRIRGVHEILVAALPLASWLDDASFLTRSLELARGFLEHPEANQRTKDRFRRTCLGSLARGRWRSLETGRAALREISLLEPDEDLPTPIVALVPE